MTLKVDGTNGILQAYDYQVLTTGFSYTFAAGTTTLIANPAGTLATGTVTMPAAPADGMVITIQSTQQVTALTVAANTGQTLVNGTVTLRQNQPLSYMYRLSNTTWYPFAGAANSDIISGTAVASTSGTSIDFTGIPSWAKRITVMLQGVSQNSVSQTYLLQIGAGSVTTSGYLSSNSYIAPSTDSGNITTGFPLNRSVGAAATFSGVATICLLGSNSWAFSCVMADTNAGQNHFGAGAITLGGTLDRVRLTTVGGTAAFDAGTVNILYE